MALVPRIAHLPERHVAVVHHEGPAETVDTTRRPVYQHMVIHELVGGPSILRWLDPPQGKRVVDALVVTHAGFDGDEVCRLDVLPAGEYAVADYEGPAAGLAPARVELAAWVRSQGRRPAGPLLQVHLMDEMDGVVEQQLQVPLHTAAPTRQRPGARTSARAP